MKKCIESSRSFEDVSCKNLGAKAQFDVHRKAENQDQVELSEIWPYRECYFFIVNEGCATHNVNINNPAILYRVPPKQTRLSLNCQNFLHPSFFQHNLVSHGIVRIGENSFATISSSCYNFKLKLTLFDSSRKPTFQTLQPWTPHVWPTLPAPRSSHDAVSDRPLPDSRKSAFRWV